MVQAAPRRRKYGTISDPFALGHPRAVYGGE